MEKNQSIHLKDLTGFTETLPVEETPSENTSTSSAHRLSDLIAQAIETFRAARKIAPHAGIVKRNLRLFKVSEPFDLAQGKLRTA